MSVSMYVGMFPCVHACIRACMHACTHARMHACTHARMHACTHARMQACCMYAPPRSRPTSQRTKSTVKELSHSSLSGFTRRTTQMFICVEARLPEHSGHDLTFQWLPFVIVCAGSPTDARTHTHARTCAQAQVQSHPHLRTHGTGSLAPTRGPTLEPLWWGGFGIEGFRV